MEETEYEFKRTFPILLILSLIMIIGVSYGIWAILHTSPSVNTIRTGCFDTTYIEGSSAINLEEAYPVSDEEGLTTSPYTFTIQNTCSLKATYQINIENLDGTDLNLNYIKIAINDEEPKLLSEFEEGNTTIIDALDSKVLKIGKLDKESFITYNIRLWVDENAPLTAINKIYKGKIVVNTTVTK